MSQSNHLLRASFVLGVVCAGALGWMWLHGPPPGDPVAGSRPASRPAPMGQMSTPVASDGLALDAATALLLSTLQRSIASGDAREQEAVLSFKDEAAQRRFLDRAQKAGLTVLSQLDRLNTVRVRFDAFDALQRELLQNASDYDSVAANNLVGIPGAPSKEERAAVDQVPFGNDTLAFVGATGDRSAWGRGTTIAILDTGVSPDVTFGSGRLISLDIGLGTTPGSGAEDGHGTAVAALAAGAAGDAPGVAPAANLLSIRVTDANGTSDLYTISQGIVAAVDAGAKIVNVSLGGYSTGAVLDAALTYATRQGAIVVAAAGNDQASQLAWPAADSRVVSVGAVDKAEQQVFFSNSGSQLQLTAPGYGVQTAWLNGQRVYVDGTSASAPIVAGAIAALVSRNPSLTTQQAADLLARTANDAGRPGADPAFGRGILNLGTAMNGGNASYVDTAVASHYYDAETNQMQFVVQNRSGRAVTGMMLHVTTGTTTTTQSVPSLAAGETYVACVPVSDPSLQSTGTLRFATQLVNPLGAADQVPANNRRASVLTASHPPGKK